MNLDLLSELQYHVYNSRYPSKHYFYCFYPDCKSVRSLLSCRDSRPQFHFLPKKREKKIHDRQGNCLSTGPRSFKMRKKGAGKNVLIISLETIADETSRRNPPSPVLRDHVAHTGNCPRLGCKTLKSATEQGRGLSCKGGFIKMNHLCCLNRNLIFGQGLKLQNYRFLFCVNRTTLVVGLLTPGFDL